MIHLKNKFSGKRLLVLLAALVAIACVIVPIPYYVEGPGATIDLSKLITVNGQEDDFSGSFSLTSVGIRQATVLTAAKAKFSDFEEVVSKEALMGGASTEEYDTVTKVNGKSFASADELVAYVHGQTVGDTVTVTYLHDDQEKEASGKLIALPEPNKGKAGIGISLTSHTKIKTDENIEFDVDNIGGPSAGLMFTLEIYQQLIGEDLRKGLDIAGTGTMEADGTVGQIGGIDKKVASASESGAKIFFAPKGSSKEDTNYQEAKAAAKKLGTEMKIVPVETKGETITGKILCRPRDARRQKLAFDCLAFFA